MEWYLYSHLYRDDLTYVLDLVDGIMLKEELGLGQEAMAHLRTV